MPHPGSEAAPIAAVPAVSNSAAALERRLKVSEAAFDAIVDRCADGIVVVSHSGMILFVNAAAQSMLGRPPEELLGEPLGVPVSPGSTSEIDILRNGIPTYTAEMKVVETEWQEQPAWLVTLRDMTERKRSEERLAYLSAIIESTGDAVIGKTVNGVITSWNAAAERLYGYSREEAIGRPAERMIPEDRRAEFRKALAQIRKGERVHHFDTTRLRKDGRSVEVALKLSPIHDSRGHLIGISTIARDNTRRKSAERRFCEAIRRRDEFLAMLSHELRNPLAAIGNAASLMKVSEASKQSIDYARDVVQRQCGIMTRLLEDLLDITRVSRGKIVLRKQCLDMKTVLREAVDAVAPLAHEKQQSILLNLDCEPVAVDADAVRLQQIFVNLLTNAVRYSENGKRIWIRLEARNDRAVVRVRDEGMGMSRKALRSVFKPFVQVDTSIARAAGGMGIGLSLVRSLTELHGGKVHARSDGAGAGSEFLVTLPRSAGMACESIDMHNEEAPGGLRVLIVEDHPDVRAMLCSLLELSGYDVEVAEDGLQGAQMIEFQQPDVALVDIGLPELNGYQLAERIRSDESLRHVALVALTGYAQPEDRRRAFKAGFDAHLAKPVDMEALTAVLQQCVAERSRLTEEAPNGTPSVASS